MDENTQKRIKRINIATIIMTVISIAAFLACAFLSGGIISAYYEGVAENNGIGYALLFAVFIIPNGLTLLIQGVATTCDYIFASNLKMLGEEKKAKKTKSLAVILTVLAALSLLAFLWCFIGTDLFAFLR